jgi:hypothetical protein
MRTLFIVKGDPRSDAALGIATVDIATASAGHAEMQTQFKPRVTPTVFRSGVPPLMAGMNLGMSERNDTMAAHRSVVAVRNSNWAEDKSNRGGHALHASRKELTAAR